MFHNILTPTGVPFLRALLLSLPILSARLVAAGAKTVIIDDTYGDEVTGALPAYNPPARWTRGRPCVFDSECFVDPDPNEAARGTWHDAVGKADPPRTIDLNFEGNSVSVYCIVSQVDRVEIAVSNMTFELDGAQVGTFYHDPDGSRDGSGRYRIAYNVSVFESGPVPQGKHTLRISSVGYSRMLFDYAQYTTAVEATDSSATAAPSSGTSPASSDRKAHDSKPRPRLAIILGLVGGAVALLVLALLALLLIRRRRRRSPGNRAYHIDALKQERRFYGKDEVDTRSFVSSTESLSESESTAHERPATPFFPYMDSRQSLSLRPTHSSPPNAARSREALELDRHSVGASPTDSIPLMDFPSPPSSHPLQVLPRIVVTGAETHLVGPDNGMARSARKEAAEREAELTRRMREMEAALAAKYGHALPPAADPAVALSNAASANQNEDPAGSSVAHRRADSVRSTGSGSEAALRGQMDELRTEIDRMRQVQNQLVLELRDATEPPPEYR